MQGEQCKVGMVFKKTTNQRQTNDDEGWCHDHIRHPILTLCQTLLQSSIAPTHFVGVALILGGPSFSWLPSMCTAILECWFHLDVIWTLHKMIHLCFLLSDMQIAALGFFLVDCCLWGSSFGDLKHIELKMICHLMQV